MNVYSILAAAPVTVAASLMAGGVGAQGAPINITPDTARPSVSPLKTRTVAPPKTRSVNLKRLPRLLRSDSRAARANRLSRRAYALSRRNTPAAKGQAVRLYLQACRLGRKQACDNARLIRSWLADHRGKQLLRSGRFDKALKQFQRSLALIPPGYPLHRRVALYNVRRAEAMAQEARRHNWKPGGKN